ncbi:MAG: hypothetical protein H3C30_08670 [Candidatus Hydrogenedentes bacterium]|nr:hypothetical protein [Candidatus Hydrogenedentota bacterium]
MNAKLVRRTLTASLLMILVIISFFAIMRIKLFFDVDACLDAGGQWDHERCECIYGDAVYNNLE